MASDPLKIGEVMLAPGVGPACAYCGRATGTRTLIVRPAFDAAGRTTAEQAALAEWVAATPAEIGVCLGHAAGHQSLLLGVPPENRERVRRELERGLFFKLFGTPDRDLRRAARRTPIAAEAERARSDKADYRRRRSERRKRHRRGRRLLLVATSLVPKFRLRGARVR